MQCIGVNDTERYIDYNLHINEIFEFEASKNPHKVAFVFKNNSINYYELNNRANKLARFIMSRGLKVGDKIGIYMERSIELIVGLLAIIKVGGTYIALDTSYPEARINRIIKDTDIDFLLCQHMATSFEFNGTLIVIDDNNELINQELNTNLKNDLDNEYILNIVYTSSSTGNPKGVIIKESSVLNRLYWMWEEYPFQKNDVTVLQKSYSLVAATWEIFGGLLKGIPTLILSREDIYDSNLLWNKLKQYKITHILASPAFFKGIIHYAEKNNETLDYLRFATTSAEPISMSMVRSWYKVFPKVDLLNLYGATECSSNVTCFNTREVITNKSYRKLNNVPIGKPIYNSKVYILDEDLLQVENGQIGEMCVSGDCVAKAYLNLPKMTKEKFVKNPVENDNNAILYRTGDLARVLPCGNIELLGRNDNLVKIRGFRVQFEEVENVIEEYKKINKAIVCKKRYGKEDRLIVFLVCECDIDIDNLRKTMKLHLPEYMIPFKFYKVNEFPKTATGKVDRKKIAHGVPEEFGKELVRGIEDVTIKTPIENQIMNIWKEVLGEKVIGIHDNYFEIGSSSLDIMEVNTKINEILGRELSVVSMFEHPTISMLAEYLVTSKEKVLNRNFDKKLTKSKNRINNSFMKMRRKQA